MNIQYLLVFSGRQTNGTIITDEIISQLSGEMNRFGIAELELVDSPIADLTNRYLITLSGGLSDQIAYDYSTIKIKYNEPIAFVRNKEFDSFLKDMVEVMDAPCGANYSYLVKDDGKLLLHQFAIVTSFSGIHSDEDPTFFDKEIKPETLYRHFYNLPLQDEDYVLEAKMLLVAEGDI